MGKVQFAAVGAQQFQVACVVDAADAGHGRAAAFGRGEHGLARLRRGGVLYFVVVAAGEGVLVYGLPGQALAQAGRGGHQVGV